MMSYNKILQTTVILIGCFFAPAAIAQKSSTPKTIAELTSLLEDEMQKQHVAGMMLTIVKRDSTLYAGGLGFADLEKQTPVTKEHLFRQASITKLFTALGTLKLIEAGKISLHAKLKVIAPEIPFRNEWEDTNPVTIAQLLEHSTGFYDKTPFEEFNYSEENKSSLEALQLYEHFMVSRWKPGERHSYSNINYAILTYLIEKLSGAPFQHYMRTNVLNPLGMSTATVDVAIKDSIAHSKGYVWRDGHFSVVPHLPQYSAGNGSLSVSALDFANALQAYLNDWQTPTGQFLSKEMLHRSETPQTYLAAKAGLRNTYALGSESRELSGRVFRGHSGTIAGYNSTFQYSREHGVGFAFSINTYNEGFSRYATDLIARFITQHDPIPSIPKAFPFDETAVKPYLGYYRLSSSSDFFTGYFQSLQNTLKLEQHQDELRANLLLAGAMIWKSADSSRLLFTNEWAKDPRIMFIYDDEKEPVIIEDTMYFEKISAFEAWAPIVLLFLSLLLLVSSLVFGLVSTILLPLGRQINFSQYLVRILPALATLSLGLCLWVLPEVLEHIMAGTPIGNLTLSWMIGRYAFALLVLASLILLIIRWPYTRNKWLKGYIAITVLSGCYLLGVLVWSNWYEL